MTALTAVVGASSCLAGARFAQTSECCLRWHVCDDGTAYRSACVLTGAITTAQRTPAMFVSADILDMGRNVKIIMAMLCVTVVIHLMIYHERSKQVLAQSPDDGWEVEQESEFLVNTTENIQSTLPDGDGQLYKLIESSRAPFLPEYPKHVVILGYQRVGSSFFGQFFDRNPSFFYVYEPIDSIYAEIYGTRGGLNVPSDITYLPNGHPRVIPDLEKNAVINLLTNIMNCNVKRLPPGYILHNYWFLLSESYMPSWHGYRECLRHHGILRAREKCWELHLKTVCPERFGLELDKMHTCSVRLASTKLSQSDPVYKYRRCLMTSYRAAAPCLGMFKAKCEGARIRSMKTVRATMEEMDELLENNPNTRIIHLLRDPRPVVLSRSTDNSYRGIYSGDIDLLVGGDNVREAHIYCGTVVKDIMHRLQLEKAYPGKIIQVIYEDLVQNPEAYASAVYRFLDEDVPNELISWLSNNSLGGKDKVISRMNARKMNISDAESRMIVNECKHFYEQINYKWPYD